MDQLSAGTACRLRLPDIPATAKIYVGVGKKDGATANDLVAVLTKELRVERGKIGRIELRDAYSLIEIPAQDAEKVALALNGVTIRRRRVTARVDRGPTGTPGREGSPAGPACRVQAPLPLLVHLIPQGPCWPGMPARIDALMLRPCRCAGRATRARPASGPRSSQTR